MPLPQALELGIQGALGVLQRTLRAEACEARTHRALLVRGWSDSAETVDAVAYYLLGLLATAISRTLEIRSQLDDTARDRLELLRNVERITGTDEAPLTDDAIEDERNPWIAEGLWHLCLFLSSRRAELHPPGAVIALDLPHIAAKDHGLDVLAIYQSGADGFGVSFVESKAYRNDPGGAVGAATAFFRQVDDGRHDARIRQVVATIRTGMSPALQTAISPSLWKDTRAYIPNPHYDNAVAMNWQRTRPAFADLKVPRTQIVIMPNALPQFQDFFDSVAASMRRHAAAL
jgi:hypothetical protein